MRMSPKGSQDLSPVGGTILGGLGRYGRAAGSKSLEASLESSLCFLYLLEGTLNVCAYSSHLCRHAPGHCGLLPLWNHKLINSSFYKFPWSVFLSQQQYTININIYLYAHQYTCEHSFKEKL